MLSGICKFSGRFDPSHLSRCRWAGLACSHYDNDHMKAFKGLYYELARCSDITVTRVIPTSSVEISQ